MAQGKKINLTFRIYRGDQLVRTETLSRGANEPIKIGKLASSHLRLDEDENVSRMHAVIEVTGAGEVTIIDLGSTKGTVVNGKKVNKSTIADGDTVVLGDTRIVIGVGEMAAAAEMEEDAPTNVEVSLPPVAPSQPQNQTIRASVAPPALPGMPPRVSASSAAAAATAVDAPPEFGADAAADLYATRSIEVAAMLADSVVAVTHLTNPRTGRLSTWTKALFGIGAALLLVVTISFIQGLRVAAENKEAFTQWVDVDKQPAIDFRPVRLSAGLDFAVIAGFLSGIGLIIVAMVRAFEERKTPFFRIGRGSDVEFPVDALPPGMESHPLVAPQGNDFVFSWARGMKGEMNVDGRITPLEQMPPTGPIPHKARIRVEAGANTFFISSVPAPKKPTGGYIRLDAALILCAAIAFAFHGGAVGLMYLLPADTRGYSNDDLDNDLRGTRVSIKPQEDPKAPEPPKDKGDKEPSGGTGTKMALDEGKMGKKDSDRKAGQYQIAKVDNVDPQLAKEQRDERARTAGILGVMRARQGGTFASLTATGDFSAGIDDRDIQGGLIGNEPGEMQGGWGYGVNGQGAGGGGTGMGTIGTGRYGTIGHGSGTGTGYGIGPGGGGMHGRVPKGPVVSIGNATATGDLDKNTIRRYVRQKLNQIEYCYQKQLVVKPTLAGTVNTQFTIDGNGRVITVKAGGIGDPLVEDCVADIIRGIQFPKPTGGGIVNVTSYPFTFRPAGQ